MPQHQHRHKPIQWNLAVVDLAVAEQESNFNSILTFIYSNYKPVGCNYLREKRENLVKKNGLDIVQDTEIQYLDVAKQNNIYVKYSKKLFKSFRSYKFFEL